MRAARPFVGPRVSSRESAAWRPRVSPSILTPPMLLAININNTETKVGLFRGDSLEAHWRLTTTPSRTPDEWAAALTSYLAQEGRSTQEVRAAVVASDALIRGTAKLPATDLTPPSRTIGRRTEEAIRSGVLLGTADAVDGIVRRIKAEWPNGQTPHVIATGGLASLVASLVREIESVHPDLTLTGLRIAATALGLKW